MSIDFALMTLSVVWVARRRRRRSMWHATLLGWQCYIYVGTWFGHAISKACHMLPMTTRYVVVCQKWPLPRLEPLCKIHSLGLRRVVKEGKSGTVHVWLRDTFAKWIGIDKLPQVTLNRPKIKWNPLLTLYGGSGRRYEMVPLMVPIP